MIIEKARQVWGRWGAMANRILGDGSLGASAIKCWWLPRNPLVC